MGTQRLGTGPTTPARGRTTIRRGRDRACGRVADLRADVAAVLLGVLDDDRTAGHIMEVVGGDTPVGDALAALVAGP